MSYPPHHSKVLIAGGSIAGLALANALEQAGIDCLVLEKYPIIAPDVGASICIFPNGFKILDQLGCYGRIKDIARDADSFRNVTMRNKSGNAIIEVLGASKQIEQRMDYSPVFLERRVVIQALYDNLQDKSRVHTSRGVTGVSILTDGVQVTTSDGGLYVGEILIGADGIHSTVRREMWRLSNEQQPCYVTQEEQERTTTTYCCMFGISNHRQGFPEHETQHVQGEGHSYLLSTGPENDVYWFLFKKLARPAYGLYDDIPRYTEMQRAALAEEHANDRLSKGLSFGDLYQARRTATLQALPEIEFSKWHWSRVMTIGDAAHKFNPIGGQGGNSAIEDAACLANQLYGLERSGDKWKGSAVNAVFAKTQELRYSRVKALLRKSHFMQRVQAMDSWVMATIAKHIMPLMAGQRIVSSLCNDALGGVKLECLPRSAEAQADGRVAASTTQWIGLVVCGVLIALMCFLLNKALSLNIRHFL